MADELSRPWTVFLVHHTHVDIGYTEPQAVVSRRHAEFIAQALDFCSATDSLPPGERFCWTCEVSWTVQRFLARYPERAEEFFRRVREGRIEVTALYVQLTDLFGAELLEATTDYAVGLGRRHDFRVTTAMNDDVNGWAWGLADMLARRGVRFFDTGINATRAVAVRPCPRPFRWVGPAGGEVLHWHSDGYMRANGLLGDAGAPGQGLIEYLRRREADGYPAEAIALRVQGRAHDNAPPGLWLCDRVRQWNAEQRNPRLVLCTSREWSDWLAANWPRPFAEHRAGWPDWWADGNGTALRESALVRRAQANLATARILAAARGGALDPERLAEARENAALFCEHTWGAWCSTDDPDATESRAQWTAKAAFAYAAAAEAESLVRDQLAEEAGCRPSAGPSILVFNPLDWTSDECAELLVPDADIGMATESWVPAPARTAAGPAFHLVDAESGVRVPVARSPAIADSARRPAQRVRFIARGLPGRGFRAYRVAAGEADPAVRSRCGAGFVESPWLRVALDPAGGGIRSVRDAASGAEWVRPDVGWLLGEAVHERIPGPDGRSRLASWSGGIRRDAPLERTRITFGPAEPLALPFGAGVRLAARAGVGSVRSMTVDAIVYDDLPRLDLLYRMEKSPEREAEALYVAFPLGAGPAEAWLDIPGGPMRPGVDQVPGTATDWHGIQDWFAVAGGAHTVVVASPDVPLVQVGGINTGQWMERMPPFGGVIMSWVFNNYWFTNFPAEQGGMLEWRYSLTLQRGAFDSSRAREFGLAIRRPPVARVVSAGSAQRAG